MKKSLKYMFMFLMGVIFTLGAGVLAMNISAKSVPFNPSNSSWKVENLQEAIDDLYSKITDQPLVINYEVGSNASSYTRMDTRLNVGPYVSKYKYFKITEATRAAGSCQEIYFNRFYDQTSGNLSINQQYELNILTNNRIMVITSGSAGCYYNVTVQFYN